MFNLSETLRLLKAVGYSSDCLEEVHLRYAIRVGACSYQYKELIWWLERKCQQICSDVEHKSAAKILTQLRQSILNKNLCETSPLAFRYRSLNAILAAIYSKIANRNSEDNYTAALIKPTVNKKAAYDKYWHVSLDRAEPESDLIVFICDQLSPTGEIADRRWESLKATISSTIPKLIASDDASNIFYEDRSDITYKLRVITCSNSDALAVLRSATGMAPALWPNAAISIMSKDECAEAFNISAWIWIYGYVQRQMTDVLEQLAEQNSTIAVNEWSFYKYGPLVDNGQYILLLLNEDSLPALKKANCYLNFNGQLLYVSINRKLGKWFDLKSLTVNDFCEE